MTMGEQQKHAFKQVKRRLSAIQKMLKMDLKDDQLPRAKDVSDFVAASEEMETFCPKAWRKAMDRYMDRLRQFQTAMAGRDLQTITDVFQKVVDGKVACHKEFRKK